MITLINWKKAEFADLIRVVFKDGSTLVGMGEGISLAEDFDDEAYAKDTFFIATKDGVIAVFMDEIKDIVFLK